jgi:hypothetical protein
MTIRRATVHGTVTAACGPIAHWVSSELDQRFDQHLAQNDWNIIKNSMLLSPH